MRSYSMRLSLSLYTNPTHTHHARGSSSSLSRSLSLARVTTRGCPLASLDPPRDGAAPHTPTHDFPTMHGLTMTAAVVGTKMTTRATSSSSRVSRGALTIVNSGAGPKRVRPTRARTNARRHGWNARARGGARWWWCTAIARARDDARVGMTTRNDGCGEIKFYFYVSRGSRRGRARGDVDGGRGRRIDRAIATGPAYPREGW